MRLDDDYDYEYDYEEHHGRLNLGAAVVVVSVFIFCILAIVVLMNKEPEVVQTPSIPESEEETTKVDEFGYPVTSELVEGSGLTPDDLDFWDMYPKEDESMAPDVPDEKEKEEAKESESESEESELLDEEGEKKDPLDDGKHTLIEYKDGTKEWVVISPYLPKNTYDFTKLASDDEQMKYVEDGRKVSFLGVDISKYQGEVDFYQLKDAGVDFVMLRVGARGYGTGEIRMDDSFATNIQKATEAGLDIGVYFFSQAVTEEEAVEEANLVIQSLAGYTIQYPVAFDMEYVDNDTARVEALTRADKTTVTKAFLDTVQAAGYRPMIYGTKEWLIKRIDLSKLTNYDIWLSQQKDVPDYPYQFAMWQYTTSAEINGISGYADLNLCFIDFAAK